MLNYTKLLSFDICSDGTSVAHAEFDAREADGNADCSQEGDVPLVGKFLWSGTCWDDCRVSNLVLSILQMIRYPRLHGFSLS